MARTRGSVVTRSVGFRRRRRWAGWSVGAAGATPAGGSRWPCRARRGRGHGSARERHDRRGPIGWVGRAGAPGGAPGRRRRAVRGAGTRRWVCSRGARGWVCSRGARRWGCAGADEARRKLPRNAGWLRPRRSLHPGTAGHVGRRRTGRPLRGGTGHTGGPAGRAWVSRGRRRSVLATWPGTRRRRAGGARTGHGWPARTRPVPAGTPPRIRVTRLVHRCCSLRRLAPGARLVRPARKSDDSRAPTDNRGRAYRTRRPHRASGCLETRRTARSAVFSRVSVPASNGSEMWMPCLLCPPAWTTGG